MCFKMGHSAGCLCGRDNERKVRMNGSPEIGDKVLVSGEVIELRHIKEGEGVKTLVMVEVKGETFYTKVLVNTSEVKLS